MKKRILTGITTTGTPHIGNYLGAIKPAINLASDFDESLKKLQVSLREFYEP